MGSGSERVRAGIVAVVPIKALSNCKQRLAGVLAPGQRGELCLSMLADVVRALAAAASVAAVWVVSPDRRVLDAAPAAGAVPLSDPTGDLNAALAWAAARVAAAGAAGMLVVPGDVPGLRTCEVEAVVSAAAGRAGGPAGAVSGPAVVICPTRDGGTGALLLRPPQALAPRYGPNSARRHLYAAAAAGLPVQVLDLPGFALDLDRPEDLVALCARPLPGDTATVLRHCLERSPHLIRLARPLLGPGDGAADAERAGAELDPRPGR